MLTVRARFYAELNDHLPPQFRQVPFDARLEDGATVRDLLAAHGVPPAVVDLVLVNGGSSPLERPLRDGDHVSLYPVFEAMDIGAVGQVRDAPLRQTRFVATPELHRLARYLRLLGFDTECAPDRSPASLAPARNGGRILLTRDSDLIAELEPTHAVLVQSSGPRSQARELLRRLHLPSRAPPPPRCLRCNRAFDAAARCPECGHRLTPVASGLVASILASAS